MSADQTPHRRGLSRRQFLPAAAGSTLGLAIAGLIGYEIHPDSASGATVTKTVTTSDPASSTSVTGESAELQSFVTRPDLRPPVVHINQAGDPADASQLPYILFASNNVIQGGPVQQGLMITNRQGQLIYFLPADQKPFDLNVQDDRGRTVLTWWAGHLVSSHGAGTGFIYDENYKQLQTVQAGNGLQIDLHELNLTSRGTALITAYEEVTTSLKSIGGPASAKVWNPHAQEIDLKTGKVLFDWNALDHVGVDESDQAAPSSPNLIMDYMHMNSVSETTDGNLLISGRNTSALYKVNRSSGDVIWRLGGKKSDFKLPANAQFQYQHHSRAWSDTQYTVFDNSSREYSRSRGLLLDVNESSMEVSLTQAYLHPAAFWSGTLGSVTLLENGNVFVGWGAQPYFTEFSSDGTVIFDGQLPINVRSYRTFVTDWSGKPDSKPTVVVKQNPAGGFVVRVSWNGATGVARWNVLSGASASKLTQVASQEWSGFETAIVTAAKGPSFQVVAVDANGHELGRSEVV